jgi:hypothetical protein
MASKKELLKEFEDKKQELKEIEIQLKEFEELPTECHLADFMHKILCIHNHTDQCGWYYEKWYDGIKGKAWHKAEYIKKAKKILKEVDYDKAVAIIKILKR